MNHQASILGAGIVIAAFLAVMIYLIYRYRPVSIIADMLRDFRRFVVQVVYMWSNLPSVFSMKRFHQGLITLWALAMATCYIWHKRTELTPEGFMIVVMPFLGVAGYNLYQTQKEKNLTQPNDADKP